MYTTPDWQTGMPTAQARVKAKTGETDGTGTMQDAGVSITDG